jgi:hypothetical protein
LKNDDEYKSVSPNAASGLLIKRAGAAFLRLQIASDREQTPEMKAPLYLLAALVFFAASCGDSNNTGPEYLFVQTSNGAVLTDSTLTLTGISPQAGWFTDRPYREAGQIPTEIFLLAWGEGGDSFADDPPNADFTCTVGGKVVNYVVELMMPELVGDELTYTVQGIGDNDLPTEATCDDAGHLFIDNHGYSPWWPI